MKKINISILEVPTNQDNKLINSMYLTAQPLYRKINIEFNQLHRIVSSDYRQYSPFRFIGGIKVGENWNNMDQDLIILDIDDGLH